MFNRVSALNSAGQSDPSLESDLVTVAFDLEATEPHFLRELRNVTATRGNRVRIYTLGSNLSVTNSTILTYET